MALEPLNVLFGAVVALVAREAVDARKAKRRLLADEDAVLRAIKQELNEIRNVVALNLVALWDRKKVEWDHRNTYLWETDIDPLSPLPERLGSLMSQDGPSDLLGNGQAVGLLSSIVSFTTHIGLLDRQRMRFVAAQYRARVVHPDSRDEIAERIERWERKLLPMHVGLLSSVLHALAVVEVIESDRLRSRRFRVRFGTFYEPDIYDWEALKQLIRENESFELTSLTGSGGGGHHSRFQVLKHFGLAEQVAGRGWFVTARGRVVAGSGEKPWRQPLAADPPGERIHWGTFDPSDLF